MRKATISTRYYAAMRALLLIVSLWGTFYLQSVGAESRSNDGARVYKSSSPSNEENRGRASTSIHQEEGDTCSITAGTACPRGNHKLIGYMTVQDKGLIAIRSVAITGTVSGCRNIETE